MATLEDIRRQYPQYDDMSDEQLIRGLHRQSYSDMPMEEFRRRLGVTAGPQAAPEPSAPDETEFFYNPQTGQMTSRELLANHMSQTGLPGGLGAAEMGAMRGISFGGSDEAIGAVNAVAGRGGTPQQRFQFGQEYTRAAEDASREAGGRAFTAGEIAGGAGTGLTYGLPAMAQRGLGGAMVAGAGVGAAEGTVYGGLSGEGGAGRVRDAVRHGLFGAGVGGAAPAVVAGLGQAATAVGDAGLGAVDYLRQTGRQSRANRAIATTAQRSGRSLDDVDAALRQAAQEGQPEFRAMDALGVPGQRRASGVVRSGGDGSNEIREFLDQRNLDQGDRVAAFVGEAFDVSGRSASEAQEVLRATQKATADINYEAARRGANAVNLNPVVGVIDDALGQNPAIGQTSSLRQSAVGQKLQDLRARMQNQSEQLIDFDSVLTVKTDLGAMIRNLRTQNQAVPPALGRVYNRLDTVLEASSSGYRAANDRFRRMSRLIESVDEGRRMQGGSQRAADTTRRYSEMPTGEQRFARMGYGDEALKRVEGRSETANAVQPFNRTRSRDEFAAIAKDPDRLARQIGRENEMVRTNNIAAGGSRTADNIEDIADLQGYDASILASILSGQFRTAGTQAVARSGNALTGMNESTRRLVADALLSQDTTALRAAMKQVENPASQKAIWNAILRSGALRGVDLEALTAEAERLSQR